MPAARENWPSEQRAVSEILSSTSRYPMMVRGTGRRGGSGPGRWRLDLLGRGKSDGDGGAQVDAVTVGAERAAMELDELAGKTEAETEPTHGAVEE